MYYNEMSERLAQPGVAVGLAWTENGGQIMFVEALSMAGEGQLTLTGQLGDVMKESATLALNWVRSHAKKVIFINTVVRKINVFPNLIFYFEFVTFYKPHNSYVEGSSYKIVFLFS